MNEIFILSPGSCPRDGGGDDLGGGGGQNFNFFENGHVAYYIKDTNKMFTLGSNW